MIRNLNGHISWNLIDIQINIQIFLYQEHFKQKCYRGLLDRAYYLMKQDTVTIISFRTDRPGQTVQTQIRLLLEEQYDQGLHCL